VSIPDDEHEDAFKSANLHAGKTVNMPDALKSCRDKDTAIRIIAELQTRYEECFDAFIAGVRWAREEAKKK